MYLKHFGLSESPFRITPHTDFFFAGANRGAMLEALQYALLHDEGIIKVSGEVGSGKTMLCRVLMERLPDHVEIIYLANPSLARDEILLAIADELQLDLGQERQTRVLRALQDALIERYAAGRRVVVLIDEAHAMPPETLEEIRLLSNLEANRHKLLQIVLFGQPELDANLGVAQMRQLKERITHSFRLGPLSRGEITSYIDYRMRAAGYHGPSVFTPAAIRLIADASEGLTRRVNILADKSLLAAFASNTHSVTQREVRLAVRDSEFYTSGNSRSRYVWLGAGVAGGLILGGVIAYTLSRTNIETPRATATAPQAQQETKSPPPAPAVAPSPAEEKAASPSPDITNRTPEPEKTTPPVLAATEQKAQLAPRVSDQPTRKPEKAIEQLAAPATTEHEGSAAAFGKYKLVQARFDSTQEWLKTAPENNYSIQLITVKSTDLAKLESFLAKASRQIAQDDFYVYSVKIDGQQHFRAAYGLFPSSSAASGAIKDLPANFQSQNPYPRSVGRMRSQNSQ